jgi:hypothetical protein
MAARCPLLASLDGRFFNQGFAWADDPQLCSECRLQLPKETPNYANTCERNPALFRSHYSSMQTHRWKTAS